MLSFEYKSFSKHNFFLLLPLEISLKDDGVKIGKTHPLSSEAQGREQCLQCVLLGVHNIFRIQNTETTLC